MNDADRNAIIEDAAAVLDERADYWAGWSATCNDWKRKVEYDASAAALKDAAARVRALKTELATPAGEPST